MSAADKLALTDKLHDLEETLNYHLAKEYLVDPTKTKKYEDWKGSHKPFHWYIDFYPLMAAGGFDVVLGNPPYKDLKSGGGEDTKGYETIATKNLYPLCFERSLKIGRDQARIGLIVPVSSISTEGYKSLQKLVFGRPGHISSFDDRPSRLFDGLEHIQLSIHLLINRTAENNSLLVTDCRRWSAVEREFLFSLLAYTVPPENGLPNTLPKIRSSIEASIWGKIRATRFPVAVLQSSTGGFSVYYSRKVHNFLQVLDFVPEVYGADGALRPPTELKPLRFESSGLASLALCALNSSLFRWYIQVFTDCRHVNKREVDNFPLLMEIDARVDKLWSSLAKSLSKSLKENSEFRSMKFAHDHLNVQCIIPKKSKPIIDQIDAALAQHFGLTDDELDFIVNCDIKYRLGKSNEATDD